MFENLGIVKHGKALAYGTAGRFKWLSHHIQGLIVGTWNHITCKYYGHTGLMLSDDKKMIIFGTEKYPICTNCSKEVKEFKNEDVVRAPTLIECAWCDEEKECFYIPDPFMVKASLLASPCPKRFMWLCEDCIEEISNE